MASLSGVGPGDIQKVFLQSSAPTTQELQARLEAAKKERDNALRDLGRINTTRLGPSAQVLHAEDVLLAVSNRALEALRTELASAKVIMDVVLLEKESQIREATGIFTT